MNGQWVFRMVLEVVGQTNLTKVVKIMLFVDDKEEAEKQSKAITKTFKNASEENDRAMFKHYCSDINDEDGIRIIKCSIVFEKELNVQIPPILEGP